MKAKVVANKQVSLRPARISDLELILSWRSHPLIYKFFRQQTKPLTWEEHINFWLSRKHRKDFIILMQEEGKNRRVGTINFSHLNTPNPEIGILVGELSLHGKGVGSSSLALGLKWLKEQGFNSAQVNINRHNLASMRIFTSAGFTQNPKNTNKVWINYEKHL